MAVQPTLQQQGTDGTSPPSTSQDSFAPSPKRPLQNTSHDSFAPSPKCPQISTCKMLLYQLSAPVHMNM